MIRRINEANLNLRELEVKNEIGKRGDVLVRKIREGEPLMVNKDGVRKEIVIINKEQILPAITNIDGSFNAYKATMYFTMHDNPSRYKLDAIHGDDGELYKLNDLEKTAYFGSSKGSSLGSVDTRFVESIICIFLAWRQLKRADLTEQDFDDVLNLPDEMFQEFKRIWTSLDSKMEITQETILKYEASWKKTFVYVPNFLYYAGIVHSGFKNEHLLDPQKLYKFYQLSSSQGPIKALKEAFQRKHPGVNFAKWNPSDIFAVDITEEENLISQLESCKTSVKLNEIVDKSFDSRKMIGISLKKIKKESDIKIIVNKVTRPPKYTLKTIRLSRLPFATLGLEIIADRRSREFGPGSEVLVIRTRERNKLVNISAEVRGKTAKHGNMSLTQINKILLENDLETVPTVTSKAEKYYEKGIEDWTEEELREEILLINQKIIDKYGAIIDSKDLAIEVDRIRLLSKYQSLFLAWVIMEAQEVETDKEGVTLADKIIEEMFHFALSINITPGKEGGRTPKYARIID
jgi:hypothetical protein